MGHIIVLKGRDFVKIFVIIENSEIRRNFRSDKLGRKEKEKEISILQNLKNFVLE